VKKENFVPCEGVCCFLGIQRESYTDHVTE
jgi:hypothetical protein